MAYCSYCAAVLDPNLTMCTRCGQPLPVAPAPAPAAVPSGAHPTSVRVAAILLAVALVISVLYSMKYFLNPSLHLSATYWMQTGILQTVWIVLLILFLQRQAWTRIGIALLIVWNIGNLAFTILRFSTRLSAAFAVIFLIAALRLAAGYMMFKPESNAWFKSK